MTTLKRLRNRSPQRARSTRQGGQWSPQYLGLYSAYDGAITGTSALITDTSGNARADMTLGATTAAPTWLPYSTSAIWIPGVSGNQITCPDAAAFAFTGDQDIRWCGSLTDWTPAANTALMAQDSGGAGGRRFSAYINSAGKPALIWSTDGTAVITKTSTVAFSIADGATGGVRFTLDVDDGAGNNVVRFYEKSGAATLAAILDNTGWTLVDTVTTAGTTSVSGASTDVLRVCYSGALGASRSTVMAAAYMDGIAGTTVAAFDATQSGQTGYTGSLGNVWTISRSTSGLKTVAATQASSSTVSKYVAATDDYFTGPAAAVPPATAGVSCSMWAVVRPWATQVANNVIFSTRSGTGAGVTLRMASATTMVADVSDGSTTATTPAVTFTPGQNLICGVILAGGAPGTAKVFVNNTVGSTVARTGNTETGGALYSCANSTPTNFAALEVRAPFVASATALSTGDIANLAAYYYAGV